MTSAHRQWVPGAYVDTARSACSADSV